MWKLFRSKKFILIATGVLLVAGAHVANASGPIASITITRSNSNNFTAGIATNTSASDIFVNVFASDFSPPSAGQEVLLEILDGGELIDNGMTPTSFTTQGTSQLWGGNATPFPLTFFRAGTVTFRARSGAISKTTTIAVDVSSATKLVVLAPGETHVPGTNPALTNGKTGSSTPQVVNQAFSFVVILTDNQFNQVSGAHNVAFASGSLITFASPSGTLGASGLGSFQSTITGPNTTRVITVTDTTDPSVKAGEATVTTVGPPAEEVTPYPSPFNPAQGGTITFEYRLDVAKDVHIIVTDLFGRKVWERSDAGQAGINSSVVWNGRNDNGEMVAAGVYYVLFETGGSIQSKTRFGVIK